MTYGQSIRQKCPEILGKICHLAKGAGAPVVDAPQDLASPVGGNVVFSKPLHKGDFCKILDILLNTCGGQCRPLNREVIYFYLMVPFQTIPLTHDVGDNNYNSLCMIGQCDV
jgi:hypothetical protein